MSPWSRLDDAMVEHRKTRRVLRDGGLAAFGLHALGILHCSRYLTDGLVERAFVDETFDLASTRERDRTRVLTALEEHQLWLPDGNDWRIHDFLDHNPSRAQVEEKRRKDAERKANGRRAPSRQTPGGVHAESARTDAGVRDVSARPVPSRPTPIPTTPFSKEGTSRGRDIENTSILGDVA